ncbi:long-chain-fatty-acid--CoA ligase [Hyphomonas sp.]
MPALTRYRDQVAVIDGAYRASFVEHADRVFRLAHGLKNQLGISRKDRFAVMAVNSHEYLELYHAAFLGAGIINPLNLRLAPQELAYIIRNSGAEIIFVDQYYADLIDSVLKLDGSLPVRKTILIGDGEGPHDLRYEQLLADAEPDIPEEPDEDDPVVLMYTGGTTGLPKGVVATQRAQILNCYHVDMTTGMFRKGARVLIQTPVFHVASIGGILWAFATGGTTILVPMFEPTRVLAEIEKNQVTATAMVPTMIHMLMSDPAFSADRIRSLTDLTYGASPMPAVLLDRLQEILPGIDIVQGYGMTESCSVLTFLTGDDHRAGGERLRSVGRPVPGVALSIQDESGALLPPGEIGEVCARGGNFMARYWNNPEATEKAFQGGWYHTGDAGYLDEDGYLFLVDRVKDMIISGGENIYSVEVENAISSHPSVAQVAVIGIPDDRWGEAVHAIVVLKEGIDVSEKELIDHARGSIAGFKIPKSVEFRTDPLPLSGAMKVLKRELRAPFWETERTSVA